VASLHRFPVKSMLGEVLESATLASKGLMGDRAYALVDDETQKVVSVKRPRRWGRIFELAASTRPDGTVGVTFPDAAVVGIDDPGLNDRLSAFFGRRVSVADTPPPDATFDEAWERELKNNLDPYFDLPSRIEDGDELIDAGVFMSPGQNFFNFGAVHIVTTSTTRQLSEHAPDSRFDPVRFRPNVVIETDDDGFVETAWQGCTLAIGSVRLAVSFTVPRCVMTTLEQGDCPADRDVLRTITQHNSLSVMGSEAKYPCVGVYADVTEAGDIRSGDAVTLVT
jgi:uncharacterized protein YcbX